MTNVVPTWQFYIAILALATVCLLWALSVLFPDNPKYPDVKISEEQWQQLIQKQNADLLMTSPSQKPSPTSHLDTLN